MLKMERIGKVVLMLLAVLVPVLGLCLVIVLAAHPAKRERNSGVATRVVVKEDGQLALAQGLPSRIRVTGGVPRPTDCEDAERRFTILFSANARACTIDDECRRSPCTRSLVETSDKAIELRALQNWLEKRCKQFSPPARYCIITNPFGLDHTYREMVSP